MSSDERDVVLTVDDLAKVYRVFGRPHHRVLQRIADARGSGRRYCFEVPAVAGVSFDLRRGETIAIIGRNGSGKSTLLEMIAGTLEPTRGRVWHSGRVSALLELGAGFNPDFSGRENFRINAGILGLTENQIDEIEPAVETFAEIGEFIDEPVRTYSSGMYVRLAFATAVHVIPDLLIVDEALAVGDVFFQQKCFDYLTNQLGQATKIIVTHDLASAVRLAGRCLVMERGRVVFDGPPLAAVETYTALALAGRAPTGSAVAQDTEMPPPPAHSLEPQGADTSPSMELNDEGIPIDPTRSSNPEALTVLRFRARRTHHGRISPVLGEASIVVPGDRLTLAFTVSLRVHVEEPVWGYLIRDRVGNALFGQNTVGSDVMVQPLVPGNYEVSMTIDWPEVEPGDYVLTFGLGNGRHPLHHRVVAWVQSVAKFTSAPERAVHGAFNNDIQDLSITALSGPEQHVVNA